MEPLFDSDRLPVCIHLAPVFIQSDLEGARIQLKRWAEQFQVKGLSTVTLWYPELTTFQLLRSRHDLAIYWEKQDFLQSDH